MPRKLYLALVILLAGIVPVSACVQPKLTPDGAAQISAYLHNTINTGRLPGAVALVVGCNGPLYHEAFGMQDAGRSIAMRKNTIFRIASMTKPLTSLALMKLVEQGHVGLDDEARRWVPWLAEPHVIQDVDLAAQSFSTRPAASPVTVRQLLTHTSGIGYSWSDQTLALAEKRDPQQTFLLADPGTRWIYGAGTKALGDIVTSVTNQSFDVALKHLVLDPIGATETTYRLPPAKQDRLVTVHRRTGSQLVEEPNPVPAPGRVNADGDLYSTAEDYGRFVQMILREGELDQKRVVSASTVQAMSAPQMGSLRVERQQGNYKDMTSPYPIGGGVDTWGFGFQITGTDGGPDRRSAGSLSWGGLYNTHFWIDPSRGIGAVLLLQVLPFYDEESMALLAGFEQLVYRNLQ